MIDEKTMSFKYIKLAMVLYRKIPSIKNRIDNAESKSVVIYEDEFKNMYDYNSESTFRLVMLAYDIMVSSSTTSGKKVFILRHRVIVKDKIPRYWRSTIRKLRKLMKEDVWERKVETYNNKRNFEIGQILSRKNRFKLER